MVIIISIIINVFVVVIALSPSPPQLITWRHVHGDWNLAQAMVMDVRPYLSLFSSL